MCFIKLSKIILTISLPSESLGTMVMPGLGECQYVTSHFSYNRQNQNFFFVLGIMFALKLVLKSARCTGLSLHPTLVSYFSTVPRSLFTN
jgi:hypothetical protein